MVSQLMKYVKVHMSLLDSCLGIFYEDSIVFHWPVWAVYVSLSPAAHVISCGGG